MHAAVKSLFMFSMIAIALAIAPLTASAGTCYRTNAGGTAANFEITVLWSGVDDVMDQIEVSSSGVKAVSDLNCTVKPPYRCTLSDDGGQVRVLFDGDRMKVVAGPFDISSNEDKSLRLSVGGHSSRVVHDLSPVAPVECEKAFPERQAIKIF